MSEIRVVMSWPSGFRHGVSIPIIAVSTEAPDIEEPEKLPPVPEFPDLGCQIVAT